MLSWLNSNSNVITMFINLAMVLIWIGYFQVFFFNYRRQTRSSLFITQAYGADADATVLVTNMSETRFYVTNVLVASSDDGDWRGLTEFPPDGGFDSFQGTLASGQTIKIGRISRLLSDAEPGSDITILVIGYHGTEEEPLGAKRVFQIVEEDDQYIYCAKSAHVEQLRSRSDRKWLVRLRNQFTVQ